MTTLNPATETDRVRRYTSPEMLHRVENQIEENIAFYGAQPPHIIARRIEELKSEWSINRVLQMNVATAGFLSAILALARNKRWGLITAAGFGFFLFHGLQGWDPPIPLLRRMGFRTRGEINREIYALKVARGDFKNVPSRSNQQRVPVTEILRAVNA